MDIEQDLTGVTALSLLLLVSSSSTSCTTAATTGLSRVPASFSYHTKIRRLNCYRYRFLSCVLGHGSWNFNNSFIVRIEPISLGTWLEVLGKHRIGADFAFYLHGQISS